MRPFSSCKNSASFIVYAYIPFQIEDTHTFSKFKLVCNNCKFGNLLNLDINKSEEELKKLIFNNSNMSPTYIKINKETNVIELGLLKNSDELFNKMTVKTNKNCSGYDNFDGTYQYKGETSAKDTKDIKDNAGGF